MSLTSWGSGSLLTKRGLWTREPFRQAPSQSRNGALRLGWLQPRPDLWRAGCARRGESSHTVIQVLWEPRAAGRPGRVSAALNVLSQGRCCSFPPMSSPLALTVVRACVDKFQEVVEGRVLAANSEWAGRDPTGCDKCWPGHPQTSHTGAGLPSCHGLSPLSPRCWLTWLSGHS